jgi:3D (Asp-Asp-Asp) domain-containing protein
MRAPAGFWNGTYVPDNYSQRYDTGRLSGGYDDSINLYTPVSTQETQEDVLTTPEPKLISVGEFKLTAYCPCVKCCGKWSAEHPNNQYEGFIQKTAGGTIPKANHTIAADWSKLPKGTKVLINGTEYVVEDKGGVVKGNHIDIYFEDHQEALVFGVQYAEVFIIE